MTHILLGLHMQGKTGSTTPQNLVHPYPNRLTESQYTSLVSAVKQQSRFHDTLLHHMLALDVDLGVAETRHFSAHAYASAVTGHLATQDLPERLGWIPICESDNCSLQKT